MAKLTRRSMMRGVLAGGVGVTVGVPLLDCFLNSNGTALASGAPLPVRFGTYFWGLGMTAGPDRWVPKGPTFTAMPETAMAEGLESKMTVFSGFRVHMDGRSNVQHHTGNAAILSGVAPRAGRVFDGASFDTAVADELGRGARFRSLELTPFGGTLSYSTRNGTSFSTPESSPISLYTRIFGEGFQDPNSDSWTPSRDAMLRKSVLSAITEQRQDLMKAVGASDRSRLDQYYTSLREAEEQLSAELVKPAKAEACVVPTAPEESARSAQIDVVNANNRLMAQLMAMALSCNQTRVFNVVHTSAGSGAFLPNDPSIYHLHTHEEVVDPILGYQPISSRLATLHFGAYAEFAKAMDAVPEGDGTLLDNSLLFGFSDTGNARTHSTDNIPMFFAGKAGGKLKGGQHFAGAGEPVSRVSLTAMQAVGMPVGEFGVGAMKTTKSISEVMA